MGEQRIVNPWVAGSGPTSADNCAQVLDMIEWGLQCLDAYLGCPLDASNENRVGYIQ